MTKKIVLVVFSIECVVLAVLLAREWTRFYISGPSEKAYATVYTDKVDAGHVPLTAEIDAGTTAFVIWWGGVLFLLFGVGVGGPAWAFCQLWPVRRPPDDHRLDITRCLPNIDGEPRTTASSL